MAACCIIGSAGKSPENRMHHECLPAGDELFKLVDQASAAMHRLAIHVHYAACEKVKRR